MEGNGQQSVGQTVKDSQTGKLPIGSVQEILDAAPKDLKEEVFSVEEWGYSVRIRSFTAAAAARIKQIGFNFVGDETDVAWGEMEKTQFMEGVIEPKFTEEQVVQLHITSGPGFQSVLKRLDEISNMNKKKVKEAQKEFRESEQSS